MNTFWQEEDDDAPFVTPDDILDVAFEIRCRALPVDHAEALHRAISEVLPWFAEEVRAGLHLIHGAESGNGWERPEDGDELLYLSRRTKLTLRLPKERLDQAESLSGRTLRVAGYDLTVGTAKSRRLSTHPALYARYVVCDGDEDEDSFLKRSVDELRAMELKFKKVLCGKMHTFRSAEGEVTTRSLFVADLPPEGAVRLQERGVGPGRQCGFGVFIPHKTVTKK